MHRQSHSTIATSFHTHGLIGIDLDHATQRRKMQFARSRTSRSIVSGFRQRLGAAIIEAGEHLAGRQTETAGVPHAKQNDLVPTG